MHRSSALIALLAAASIGGSAPAAASDETDFYDPAVVMSGDAVIASGNCIAKYAVELDDRTMPAASIGERVAEKCAREISRSAGLAAWMQGIPEDFAKNLKYAREDLTTGTVVRSRAAADHRRID